EGSSGETTTADDSTTGACSKITCAFVPLIPNDDTADRRGRSTTGHSRATPNNDTAPADQSTCDDDASTCNDAAITPCRIPSTNLITPATPAAACACPIFDFNDPRYSGSPTRPCPYVANNA